jgi:phage gp46-like protein
VADIELTMHEYGGDIRMNGPDLARDDGLETAVTISLFTDRRAAPDQLPAELPKDDLRGWWGDTYAEESGDLTGSHLWLLSREKVLPEVPGRAEGYCYDALQWFVDDGIAKSITVAAGFLPVTDWLYIEIQISQPDGNTVTFRFEYEWKAQALKRV